MPLLGGFSLFSYNGYNNSPIKDQLSIINYPCIVRASRIAHATCVHQSLCTCLHCASIMHRARACNMFTSSVAGLRASCVYQVLHTCIFHACMHTSRMHLPSHSFMHQAPAWVCNKHRTRVCIVGACVNDDVSRARTRIVHGSPAFLALSSRVSSRCFFPPF